MSYATSQEHLLDELSRIDAILDSCDPQAVESEADSTAGDILAADSETLTQRPQELPLALPAGSRRQIADETERITERSQQTDGVRLRVRVLAETCELSRRHLDVLLLALAPRVDESYHAVFQQLHSRESLTYPTEILLETLFATTPQQQLAAGALVGSDSPLRRYDLIELQASPDPDFGERGRLITVSDRIVEYLKGYDGVDPELDATLAAHSRTDHALEALVDAEATATLDSLCVDDDLHGRLTRLADEAVGSRRFYWYGPATEKQRAVEAVCSSDQYLRADLAAVLDAGAAEWLRREAALLGRPLHLYNATGATDHPERNTPLETVFDAFVDLGTDVFVTGSDSWTPTETMTESVDAIVEFPYPSAELRRAFWSDHEAALPATVDPNVLAGTFRLTHGQLQAALSTARSLADGEELTPEAIYAGCNAQSTDGLDDLADRIDPDSSWDDIQLRPETERKLRLVRTHIVQQARIYDDWGFAEAFSRGTGVVALFEGPSGTGKTMAAEILAGDIGMDLYRIDLSSVVSKYIGETEQNLEEIFQAATNSNAVLLFDEADAVFGDRAEVSDATDRYANAEVNYLLQRIESYDGVVFLTTNYASQIDSAFQRRLDHTVSFKQPQQSTRSAIWEGIFPDDTPVGDIDYEFLSSFEFTGGDIKQIGQTAAVLAADDATGTTDDVTIEMRHLVGAIQLAFKTNGRMVDASTYEPYQHLRYHPSEETIVSAESSSEQTIVSTESSSEQSQSTTDHDSGDETDPQPTDRSPEGIVRRLFDRLHQGNGTDIDELYHPRSLVDPPSAKELRRLSHGEASIVGKIEREQDDSDRVVLGFVREVNETQTRVSYELRPDYGKWRIFNQSQQSELNRPTGR